jgi:hypothetical protein
MPSVRPRFFTLLPVCLAQCALLGGMVTCVRAETPRLKLLLYTPMDVDGTATTASTTLQLYNPSSTAAKYSLQIDDPVARNTGQPAGWVVAFYGADNKPGGPICEGTIAARSSLSIRVDLSHVLEAGETDAQLVSFGQKIAPLVLSKDRDLPFKVSLEGNAAQPEIDLVNGKPFDLHIRNDDPMDYPIAWELSLKGSSKTGVGNLGPNGSTTIPLVPDGTWFSLYQSFLRSENLDGTLRVGYKPPGATGSYPSKTIPVKVHLNDYDPGWRDFWGTVVILIFLALGGITSAYVNVALVNRIKAIGIRQRLGQLARIVGEVQPQLNSQLRVSLWLERGRIDATLPRQVLFTPETTAVLTQSDTDTQALKTRVDWASQISEASSRLMGAIAKGALPPTLFEQGARALDAAQNLLKRSLLGADDVQKIQVLVGQALNLLNNIANPDPDLESKLVARMAEIAATFTPAVLGDPLCMRIRARVPIPFSLLNPGTHGSQTERDENTRKLGVIAGLLELKSEDPEVLDLLARHGCMALSMAEQLLVELQERISLADLIAEISATPPRVFIKVDRDTVRVSTPFMLKLTFNNQLLDRAAAKQRIVCTWSFDHDDLTENGWEVHHYFPKAQTYTVTVAFADQNRVPIPAGGAVSQPMVIAPQRDESRGQIWVEFQRWAFGFLVAVIGLFAGAKDKIVSLDTLSAIFAVFLIGFGIDMAKNLLVPPK